MIRLRPGPPWMLSMPSPPTTTLSAPEPYSVSLPWRVGPRAGGGGVCEERGGGRDPGAWGRRRGHGLVLRAPAPRLQASGIVRQQRQNQGRRGVGLGAAAQQQDVDGRAALWRQ